MTQNASSALAAVAPDAHTRVAADARVSAVLAVLRGAPVGATAAQWSVDPTLLQRWVGAFVDAGTATVANRPDTRTQAHRDRFLAAFAFETREPLAAALGWAGRLTVDGAPAPEFAHVATQLEASLGALSARLADAELLVAASLGAVNVALETVTVASLTDDLENVGIVRGKGPEYLVDVDPDLFGRVLRDLWHTADLDPAPRSRRLFVRVVGPWVEFRILREGDPIDTDLLSSLFEPFDVDHLTTGATVGLYLARALTVAHGGTVGIDQDESGAAVWVRIPVRVDSPEPDPPARQREEASDVQARLR